MRRRSARASLKGEMDDRSPSPEFEAQGTAPKAGEQQTSKRARTRALHVATNATSDSRQDDGTVSRSGSLRSASKASGPKAAVGASTFVVKIPSVTGDGKGSSSASVVSFDSEAQAANGLDFSFDQTPATSAGGTPAAQPGRTKSLRPRAVNAHERAAELSKSKFSITGKRSRDQYEFESEGEEVYQDEAVLSDFDDRSLVAKKGSFRKQAKVEKKQPKHVSSSDEEDDVPMLVRRRGVGLLPTRNAKKEQEGQENARVDKLTFDLSDTDLSDISDFSDLSSDHSRSQPVVPTARRQIGRRAPRGRGRGRRWHEERKRENMVVHHPKLDSMWSELEEAGPLKKERMPQPPLIKQQLKPFQLEGLDWLIKQEQTKYKGGLLADEMGMGKTIQAVSLIMSDYPQPKPTLVIMPPVALMQWQNEIASYTSGKLKVLVYHGSNTKSKGLSKKTLENYNVILISYSSLESLYRKQVKGFNRKDEYGDAMIVKENSVIHDIAYHRVILDEAHNIKNRTSSSAKACFELESDYRWCLSGTPLQNRIGELLSLLRFLQIQPFANYVCVQCPCSKLDWGMKDGSCECEHSAFNHCSVFNHEVLARIAKRSDSEANALGFKNLKLLTDAIMLRREKKNHVADMQLPPKKVCVRGGFFHEIERDFATSIMTATNRKFENYVSQGVMLNNYANIFGLIMQMRQVADHPDLVLKRNAEGGQNVLVCEICNEAADDTIRSSCRHTFCRACVTEYFESMTSQGATPDCPKCHITLRIDLEQPEVVQDASELKKSSIINKINMKQWCSSTKIEMLLYELTKLRMKGLRTKSIIFSQFTSMLQLIEWRLKNAGFLTVSLNGSMTPAQRQNSIDYFQNTPKVECFLVSLKAGGVALNLTEASQVFIVDPWWNPAAEWQSADRVHRIGQCRPVTVTRLVIEDSVESRIVQLQAKKAAMISSTIDGDNAAMTNLSPEDMQFLFHG